MSNKLRGYVKKIQFENDWTVEQVAKSLNYSRVHLTKEMKKDESSEMERLLLEKFGHILHNESKKIQNVTETGTEGIKEKYLQILEKYLQAMEKQSQGTETNLNEVLNNQRLIQSQILALGSVIHKIAEELKQDHMELLNLLQKKHDKAPALSAKEKHT